MYSNLYRCMIQSIVKLLVRADSALHLANVRSKVTNQTRDFVLDIDRLETPESI